jgi:hypothetical protein
MLVGASLPPVYAQAARLSRRIEALKHTRLALEQQQAQATRHRGAAERRAGRTG